MIGARSRAWILVAVVALGLAGCPSDSGDDRTGSAYCDTNEKGPGTEERDGVRYDSDCLDAYD